MVMDTEDWSILYTRICEKEDKFFFHEVILHCYIKHDKATDFWNQIIMSDQA